MDQEALDSSQPSARARTSANEDEHQQAVLIPDHELLRCIGRGSYGEVWLARNMMGTYRAVKIVYRKSFENERPFLRELSGIRKFEPISRSYEGFVDVLHVGINEERGYFYYVMELGDDQTLGQNVDPVHYAPKTLAKELSLRITLSLQECLQLGLALSQALAELHKHGLVHRDVKPSNIIFVNGVPKLADIGLVAEVSEARSYVGTEGFIPPEGPGTPPADVYGLGKVLYEVSTGKDRQDFPELPTQLDKFPDHEGFLELNEVILHACKYDVSKRYQSAWDLHADLLVLANGKSVKRLKILERRLANLKRVAGVSALVLAVLAAIAYQVYRERRAVVEARQRQVGANVAYGNRAVESGDLLGALPYYADALRLEERNLNQETTHRLRLGSALAQCPKLTHMWFAGGKVNEGEFSPDGTKALIAPFFGKAKIYDLQTGELYSHPFGQGNGLRSAVFSSDGRFVLTASEERSTAYVWDAVNLEVVCTLPHPKPVFSARFSHDGLRIITSSKDGLARVWDVWPGQTNRVLLSLAHTNAVLFADFNKDGRLIVTTSYDETARIWDAKDGHSVGPPLAHGSWVTYAAFSPDSQKVVTACLDRKARVWELESGKRILPDLNHGDGVTSAEFSPDGRLILTASLDGTARLWLADTLQPLVSNPILRHGERLTHASFSPDGRRIITTCSDGTTRIWDLAGGAVPPIPVPYSFSRDGSRFLTVTNNGIQVRDAVSGKAVSPLITVTGVHSPQSSVLKTQVFPRPRAQLNRNGRFVVRVSAMPTNSNETNRILQIWDVATGEPIAPEISVPNSFTNSILSDDGKRLVTFGPKFVESWAVPLRSGLALPLLNNETVGSAYLSPDGTRIAARYGNAVQIWDAATGRSTLPPLSHPALVAHAEFSPTGDRLVSCCWDDQFTKCYAQIWNTISGQPTGPQLQHGDGVLFASFSPDGTRVVTASEDFKAIVWDTATGRQLTPPLTHEAKVRTGAFSPDGKWIVTASSDKTARVWNAENGDPLTPPLRHLVELTSARFLADGRRIVTTDQQGKARIWNLPVEEWPVDDLIMLARLLSGNSVTPGDQLSSPKSESLETIWQRIRGKYPGHFVTSADEIAAWHEFQAEECETLQNWFAAAFHLKCLLSVRPEEPSLIERLARTNEHLRDQ